MPHIRSLYQASPSTRAVLILLGLSTFAVRLDSAERVLRMTEEDHGAIYGAAHAIHPERPLGRGDFDNLVASSSFSVYTTAEVDGFITAVEQRMSIDLAKKIAELQAQIDALKK
jgi:hypothetical protein